MPGPCSDDFTRLARELGDFGCETANAVVNLQSPFALDHWTMLVIEVATVVGAGLALRHAFHRRRQGDPTGLAIWIASLAYLVVVEPPLYFPDRFGLQEQVGLIFVHNEFTVQFLWNRLPLYIVAIYPALAYLSYELVRGLGIFDRRGPLTGSLTVGVVYHVFYEIFDHVGPQLHWWIWNQTAPTNEPFLASVPISSMVNFAVAGPVALTLLVRLLVARRAQAGPVGTGALVGRSVLAGVLMPIGLVVGGMPATVFTFGETINRTGQAIAYWTVLAVATLVAARAIAEVVRDGLPPVDDASRRYVLTHGGLHLVAMAISWGAALPAYLVAFEGVTEAGTPTGSLAYAAVCSVLAVGLLVVATRGAEAPAPGATTSDRLEPAPTA